MEGPLLVLKSWALTALAIWIYKRWFQRAAAPTPSFEAFCAGGPIVAALLVAEGTEPGVAAALAQRLGKRRAAVATLGTFPWPHYRLALAIETRAGAVLVRVTAGQVMKSGDRDLPALASLLRDLLNELPTGVEAWLRAGAFTNGLVEPPPGGWTVERGDSPRPRFTARETPPKQVTSASLGFREPDALVLAARHGIHDAVPRVAR
jgi:hypothetical protein